MFPISIQVLTIVFTIVMPVLPRLIGRMKIFGGSALTQNHNVNVTTGTDKTQVMLTYNYSGQDGLLANHSSNRSSFRTKINTELYKGIRLDVNAMFSNKKTLGGGAYSGMKNVLLQPINGGTMFTQDELLNTQTYPNYSSLNSNYDTANPLVQNEASTSKKKRSRMYSVNAGIEFDLFKYFTWRTAGSYTWSSSKSDSFADHNSTSYLMDPKIQVLMVVLVMMSLTNGKSLIPLTIIRLLPKNIN